MPVILGRCPNCSRHARGVWLRGKADGGRPTWERIVGLGCCPDCRLFFHLLNDPKTTEDPWTFAEVRPLVERALSTLEKWRPHD